MSLVLPSKFMELVYFSALGSGDNGGHSSGNAKSMAADNVNVWTIPAGTLIENVYMILTAAITGTTNLDFGDDDDADGYIDSSLSVTLNTPGVYGANAKLAGAYLRVETAGGTDAADIYVVPQVKYYAAAGKEIKMDLTGAGTAGSFILVIEGSRLA